MRKLSREEIFKIEVDKQLARLDYKEEGFNSQKELVKEVNKNILNRFNKILKEYA